MIFDSKGRLFGKISIVDILIIVIVIAGLGGAYYKFSKSKTFTPFTKTDKIQISFFMEDVPEYAANAVKVGDIVKDRVQNIVFGKVVEVTVGPDIWFFPNSSGQAVSSSKPGYNSISLTVEGQGTYSDTGAYFGGQEYYINKQFELRAGKSNLYTRITEINKVKE